MPAIVLSLLLALQLTLTALPPAPRPVSDVQPRRLWWGMIDPELSAWFARIPDETSDKPVMWNWSWRGFLAALTVQPLVKETADAPRL